MIFFTLMEFLGVCLIFVFFFSQIIYPIWGNKMLFPSFRFKARQLDKQLRQARFDKEISEEQKLLDKLKGDTDGEKENT